MFETKIKFIRYLIYNYPNKVLKQNINNFLDEILNLYISKNTRNCRKKIFELQNMIENNNIDLELKKLNSNDKDLLEELDLLRKLTTK